MDRSRIEQLLRAVADGKVEPAAAAETLAQLPYADLGFARLDLHRELRGGLPEAIYSEGKTDDDLAAIAARMVAAHGRLLVTRLAPERVPVVREAIPEEGTDWKYHERARIFTAGDPHAPIGLEQEGFLALLAAGTSDLPVAEEAAICAEWFGLPVERFYDVGVAGLHRLLAVLPRVRKARAIIVVAGMDGALPSVTAGLVSVPVVAVPTSVGYGASFGGVAALLSMLNSCAAGVTVVNIDNGFGAAVTAQRILCQSSEGAGGGRGTG